MALYHRNINKWKPNFDSESLALIRSAERLSDHLWQYIDNSDYKHDIDLSHLFIIVNRLKQDNSIQPFEVEAINNKVTKCVVRTAYNDNTDISIVFRKGFIVTAWLNEKSDTHSTLNKSNYN